MKDKIFFKQKSVYLIDSVLYIIFICISKNRNMHHLKYALILCVMKQDSYQD